jgi:outer membrane biosynthesis protein TonB
MPVYPALAEQARITGVLKASVVISPGGSVERSTIEMESGSDTAKRLFSAVVEKAIRASEFDKSCGGKSIRLVFHFTIDASLDPNGERQAIFVGYPNQFWITVPPKMFQP